MKGLREKIKTGELSPDEAIELVKNSDHVSESFIQWCNTTGRKRYKKTLESKTTNKKEVK